MQAHPVVVDADEATGTESEAITDIPCAELDDQEVAAGTDSNTLIQVNAPPVPVRQERPITCQERPTPEKQPTSRPIRYPQLHDRAFLEQRYTVEGTSVLDIAREIGCSPTGVYAAVDSHNIPRRPVSSGGRPFAPRLADKDWLRRRYVNDRLTARQIGSLIGMSTTSVVTALRRAGIELRSGSSTRNRGEASPPPPPAPPTSLGQPTFTVAWVSAAFDAGRTIVEIASATGTSPPAVAKLLQVAATG